MIEKLIKQCKGKYQDEVQTNFSIYNICGVITGGIIPEGFNCPYLGNLFSYVEEYPLLSIEKVYECKFKGNKNDKED